MFDSEDTAVAWGIVGGTVLAVINLEMIKEGPTVRQEELTLLLATYGATGAIGGLVGGLLLAEYAGPELAGIMGGVIGTWFLVVAGRIV